jgi:serine/threonine-protein kinase
MGAVYRARDTKLGRDVAIKVLPAALAADPARLARFQREAQVLALLNHPNIAAIYGVEDRALILELVEGGRGQHEHGGLFFGGGMRCIRNRGGVQ